MIAIMAAMLAGMRARRRAQAELRAPAENAIIMDSRSGKVMFEKNPDEPFPPASMTKIMTMLLVFEKLKEGTAQAHRHLHHVGKCLAHRRRAVRQFHDVCRTWVSSCAWPTSSRASSCSLATMVIAIAEGVQDPRNVTPPT